MSGWRHNHNKFEIIDIGMKCLNNVGMMARTMLSKCVIVSFFLMVLSLLILWCIFSLLWIKRSPCISPTLVSHSLNNSRPLNKRITFMYHRLGVQKFHLKLFYLSFCSNLFKSLGFDIQLWFMSVFPLLNHVPVASEVLYLSTHFWAYFLPLSVAINVPFWLRSRENNYNRRDVIFNGRVVSFNGRDVSFNSTEFLS